MTDHVYNGWTLLNEKKGTYISFTSLRGHRFLPSTYYLSYSECKLKHNMYYIVGDCFAFRREYRILSMLNIKLWPKIIMLLLQAWAEFLILSFNKVTALHTKRHGAVFSICTVPYRHVMEWTKNYLY